MAAVRSRFSSRGTNAKKLPLYDDTTKKDNLTVGWFPWVPSTPRVLVSLSIIKKLIMLVAGTSALLFIAYFSSIAWYNGLSVRDPCAVAQLEKDVRQRLLTIDRDLTNTISDSLISDASVDVIPATFSTAFVPTVPKIIHQQWKSDVIPEKFTKWKNKWLQYFPENEYEHMLWTDDNAREHIVNNYAWFLDTYDGYPHNINRVDAARYFILHHFGGIYADLDYEPTTNFYDELPQNTVAVVESPYYWNEKTQNCLMSSPRNDPFWIDVFAVLLRNSKKKEVLECTGPIMLDQALELSNHPTYVLPCENFQRVPLGEYSETLWTTIYDREVMFRLKPVTKHCGYYHLDQCHYGKHHNAVSYRNVHGEILD